MYRIWKIQLEPLDLNKLMRNEKRLQSGSSRDAGRSPLANIDQDEYIYFVHTRALCVAVFPPSSNALAMLRPSRCTPLWGDQDTWKRCKRGDHRGIEYTGEVFILKINCSSFAIHDCPTLSLCLFLSPSMLDTHNDQLISKAIICPEKRK